VTPDSTESNGALDAFGTKDRTMDTETIQKIAAELARHMSHRDWWQWLIQFLVVAVCAGIGAYLSEYLKTKGKNLVTRRGF